MSSAPGFAAERSGTGLVAPQREPESVHIYTENPVHTELARRASENPKVPREFASLCSFTSKQCAEVRDIDNSFMGSGVEPQIISGTQAGGLVASVQKRSAGDQVADVLRGLVLEVVASHAHVKVENGADPKTAKVIYPLVRTGFETRKSKIQLMQEKAAAVVVSETRAIANGDRSQKFPISGEYVELIHLLRYLHCGGNTNSFLSEYAVTTSSECRNVVVDMKGRIPQSLVNGHNKKALRILGKVGYVSPPTTTGRSAPFFSKEATEALCGESSPSLLTTSSHLMGSLCTQGMAAIALERAWRMIQFWQTCAKSRNYVGKAIDDLHDCGLGELWDDHFSNRRSSPKRRSKQRPVSELLQSQQSLSAGSAAAKKKSHGGCRAGSGRKPLCWLKSNSKRAKSKMRRQLKTAAKKEMKEATMFWHEKAKEMIKNNLWMHPNDKRWSFKAGRLLKDHKTLGFSTPQIPVVSCVCTEPGVTTPFYLPHGDLGNLGTKKKPILVVDDLSRYTEDELGAFEAVLYMGTECLSLKSSVHAFNRGPRIICVDPQHEGVNLMVQYFPNMFRDANNSPPPPAVKMGVKKLCEHYKSEKAKCEMDLNNLEKYKKEMETKIETTKRTLRGKEKRNKIRKIKNKGTKGTMFLTAQRIRRQTILLKKLQNKTAGLEALKDFQVQRTGISIPVVGDEVLIIKEGHSKQGKKQGETLLEVYIDVKKTNVKRRNVKRREAEHLKEPAAKRQKNN